MEDQEYDDSDISDMVQKFSNFYIWPKTEDN